MKVRSGIILLLAVLLLVGCAGAEGAYSAPSHGQNMAAVNGQVYCGGANEGLQFIPIWQVTLEGMKRGESRIGGWQALYAYGDELLTVAPVLNIGEMLGSIPTSTYRVKCFDPAAGKSAAVMDYVWNTENGVCNIFAAQDRLYRDLCQGETHELQMLEGEEWVCVARWTGDGVWQYQTFCFIGDRNADHPKYIALYEFATGAIYDVTQLVKRKELRTIMNGVLEDGVLYMLDEDDLMMLELTTGKKQKLLHLPAEADGFILTDDRMIAMSHSQQCAWVVDRTDWKIIGTVEMTEYPADALLLDGKLFVCCNLAETGVEVIDLSTGESVHYSLK